MNGNQIGILLGVVLIFTTLYSKSLLEQPASHHSPLSSKDFSANSDEHDTISDELNEPSSSNRAVVTKEEQLAVIHDQLHTLRTGPLHEASDRVHRTLSALEHTKKRSGWLYYTAEERAQIEHLDAELARHNRALAVLQQQEKALEKSIKPLYGIVSLPFYAEQRKTISTCISKVQEMSYNQAWYNGLFNAHRAESFTDLILQFFVEWFVGYVMFYPFAVLYYALWAAPWSIYEYSSGLEDIAVGAVAWLSGVFVMSLPLVALAGGVYFISTRYGENIMENMLNRRRRR